MQLKKILTLFILVNITNCFAQDTITASQAKDFVGEYKYVKGSVAAIYTAKNSNTTYINFGGNYPNQEFTAVIFKDDKSKFDILLFRKSDLVVIYGKIELYKDKPQIILKEKEQFIRWE